MAKIQKLLFIAFTLFPLSLHAEEISKNTAQMQAMDKITGRVSVINVPVDGEVKFGSLSIVVRSCQTRPEEETPDNFAFVDITDTNLQGEELNIFKGWMISSSPATHAVEHPIYDVWLLKCRDTKVAKSQLLSDEQLSARDNLPMQAISSTSVSTADSTEKNATLIEMQAQEDAPENMQEPDMNTVEFLYDEEDSDADEAEENVEEAVETSGEATEYNAKTID